MDIRPPYGSGSAVSSRGCGNSANPSGFESYQRQNSAVASRESEGWDGREGGLIGRIGGREGGRRGDGGHRGRDRWVGRVKEWKRVASS